jgi:hypothetical protein
MTTKMLAVISMIFWIALVVFAQKGQVVLFRVNVEVGFNYAPRPTGKAIIPCSASGWSVVTDWGDGTVPEIMSHPISQGSKAAPGSYLLYSKHRYDQAGSYVAKTTLSVNCPSGTVATKEQALINVFNHVGITTFSSDRATYVGGDPIVLNFVLERPAPPSGTELYVRASASRDSFSSQRFPLLVTVPPGSDHTTAEIRTNPSAKGASITLTAISATGQQKLMVQLK